MDPEPVRNLVKTRKFKEMDDPLIHLPLDPVWGTPLATKQEIAQAFFDRDFERWGNVDYDPEKVTRKLNGYVMFQTCYNRLSHAEVLGGSGRQGQLCKKASAYWGQMSPELKSFWTEVKELYLALRKAAGMPNGYTKSKRGASKKVKGDGAGTKKRKREDDNDVVEEEEEADNNGVGPSRPRQRRRLPTTVATEAAAPQPEAATAPAPISTTGVAPAPIPAPIEGWFGDDNGADIANIDVYPPAMRYAPLSAQGVQRGVIASADMTNTSSSTSDPASQSSQASSRLISPHDHTNGLNGFNHGIPAPLLPQPQYTYEDGLQQQWQPIPTRFGDMPPSLSNPVPVPAPAPAPAAVAVAATAPWVPHVPNDPAQYHPGPVPPALQLPLDGTLSGFEWPCFPDQLDLSPEEGMNWLDLDDAGAGTGATPPASTSTSTQNPALVDQPLPWVTPDQTPSYVVRSNSQQQPGSSVPHTRQTSEVPLHYTQRHPHLGIDPTLLHNLLLDQQIHHNHPYGRSAPPPIFRDSSTGSQEMLVPEPVISWDDPWDLDQSNDFWTQAAQAGLETYAGAPAPA